ncbi:MAG: redoxin domain-containing protein [Candidatus Rokubacteria bacterium]|nr:redoxin domain-containing protein [Candidatus Rokubacteria bacterium]
MSRVPHVVLLLFAVLLAQPATAGWNYRIGEPAPEFQLEALDGNVYRSTDLKGKWVVVSFMTTWCPFCNAAAPHFEKLNQEYGKRGVRTFIVDISERSDIVSGWVKKQKLSCPVLLDGTGEVTTRYAPPPDFVPDLKREEVMIASFMIIDPEGTIRFLALNEDVASFDARLIKLRARLDALLPEP